MANDIQVVDVHEKRVDVAKEMISAGLKFCVGAFFGAVAAYITKDSQVPKFERYAVIAGGAITGFCVGGQASDRVCDSIDVYDHKWREMRNKKKEQEAKSDG